MIIAIDFDETLTKDAKLWRTFIDAAIEGGHKVICVTCRRGNDENRSMINEWMESHIGRRLLLYCTKLESKYEVMSKLGVKVDIWIDDDPRCIIYGK